MTTFDNKPELKEKFVAEIKKHMGADQIVQGVYGKGTGKSWKGCAVGCSIHSLNRILKKRYEVGDHEVYEKTIGVPATIAHLEDRIFEGLEKDMAMKWPLRFAEALPVGADLSLVTAKFMVWLMQENKQYAKGFPEVLKAINIVQKLYKRIIAGGTVTDEEWGAAEYAARSARSAAEYAAWSAAEYAARSAAWSAESAARSTRSAESAAEYAAYSKMADKLIELLEKSDVR